jgi:hypothetical protein
MFDEYACWNFRTQSDTGTCCWASGKRGAILGSITAQPTMYTR